MSTSPFSRLRRAYTTGPYRNDLTLDEAAWLLGQPYQIKGTLVRSQIPTTTQTIGLIARRNVYPLNANLL
jgi:hypothetical protein